MAHTGSRTTPPTGSSSPGRDPCRGTIPGRFSRLQRDGTAVPQQVPCPPVQKSVLPKQLEFPPVRPPSAISRLADCPGVRGSWIPLQHTTASSPSSNPRSSTNGFCPADLLPSRAGRIVELVEDGSTMAWTTRAVIRAAGTARAESSTAIPKVASSEAPDSSHRPRTPSSLRRHLQCGLQDAATTRCQFPR